MALTFSSACSDGSTQNNADGGAPAPACVDSACKPGNHCISTTKDRACRFPCQHHTDCPLNYHCDANAGGDSPYCVADTFHYDSHPGMWGTPCQPSGGLNNNPSCDVAQGFWCYGTSQVDANAFCTTYGCTADSDCGAGYYCGSTNVLPDVTTPATKHSNGDTYRLCLPHSYCSPCNSDVDCAPDRGVPQHCVSDTANGSFCASECATDGNCSLDARCGNYGSFSACTPRAGVCIGDGSFCSPCQSDANCQPGAFCFSAAYSNEKFCTVKSGKSCTLDASNHLVAQCPTSGPPNAKIGCTYPAEANGLPLNQCFGLVVEGTGADQGFVPGCWSVHPH